MRQGSLLVSGTADKMLMISGGPAACGAPPGVPKEIGKATAFGCSHYGHLIVSVQTLSAELGIEVLLSQTDDDRERMCTPAAYVHYDCGERIDDRCPKDIDMSPRRRRWFRR